MRIAIAVSLIVAGFAATAAEDMQIPQRKPGLWEITMRQPGKEGHSLPMRLCIDEKMSKELSSLASAMPGKDRCDDLSLHRSGDDYVAEGTCPSKAGPIKLRSLMRWTGDSAYHLEITYADQTTPTMISDAKWTGPCAPGQRPGAALFGPRPTKPGSNSEP
jgi:hypothetical protein